MYDYTLKFPSKSKMPRRKTLAILEQKIDFANKSKNPSPQ